MDLISIYLEKDLKVSDYGLFTGTNVVLSSLEK